MRLRRLGQWFARRMVLARAAAAAAIDLRDIFWMSGLGAATYGISQLHVPAAWIFCGGVLLLIGLFKG